MAQIIESIPNISELNFKTFDNIITAKDKRKGMNPIIRLICITYDLFKNESVFPFEKQYHYTILKNKCQY